MPNLMKKFLLPLGFLILLVSCKSTGNNSNKSSENPAQSTANVTQTPVSQSNLPPVETKEPNTPAYKPAFEGQTRIAGAKTATPYDVNVVTSDLKNPWSIAPMPDGRFFISEKNSGTFRIVSSDGQVSAPITGAPKVDASGQGGLLGVTLDPGFAGNKMVYWMFSEPVDGGNHAAVAKGKLSADEKTMENVQVFYRVQPTYPGRLHYGGKLAFNKDGHLFVATGERSDLTTRPLAQDNNTTLGKMLLITTDGKAVTDPAVLIPQNQKPEIFSSGHRNPLGIALHPVTGELWAAEMGPKGGDEINIIHRGKNYGWPTITYGIEYSGKTIGEGITQKAGMEQPIYYWDPSISPGGIAFYTGDDMSEWKNNLFIGSLGSTHLIRLLLDGNKVVGEERLLVNENQRFRDVAVGKDGKLYAITDSGRLYSISKK